jgi:hypothetical protein
MQATLPIPRERDTPLWVAAVGMSVVLNLAFVLLMAFATLKSDFFNVPPKTSEPPTRAVTIQPVTRESPEAAETPEERAASFARTSENQAGPAPDDAPFIGERDTRARSEKEPGEDSPILPSQDGIEARVDEVETTESEYQDGDLAHRDDGAPGAEPAPEIEPTPDRAERDASAAAEAEPPAAEVPRTDDEVAGERTSLAESPFPYDRPVRPDAEEAEDPAATPETTDEPPEETGPSEERLAEQPEEDDEPAEETAERGEPRPEVTPRPAGGGRPGFRGNQRKTQLKGSISRRGESSLDVKSGPLGRYNAALSRAIEKAWQREAVANRDYIVPGVIRVRVVLDAEGQVRSVGKVDEFGIGAIQRGFTYRAIREAELPDMPDEVRNELDGDPLELLYNFIF